MKCSLGLIKPKSNSTQERSLIERVWSQLSEDEVLSFKRCWPGEERQEVKDELQKYEPQLEDEIPANFTIVKFVPQEVDFVVYAPPAVIADQRRKPQQYESIPQPFKKDRRLKHWVEQEEWKTKEVNP